MHKNDHFFSLALHVIFGRQTVDSHVMILVTCHFLHHEGIFAQRTNDVDIEGGTVKVTRLVLFQEHQGSLVGANNEMFAVKAVAQFQIAFFLGRASKDKELQKSIFNGGHVFGVHSLLAREFDLALKVAGHSRQRQRSGQDGWSRHHDAMRVKPFVAEKHTRVKIGKKRKRERERAAAGIPGIQEMQRQ
jgi:hypothetical protein